MAETQFGCYFAPEYNMSLPQGDTSMRPALRILLGIGLFASLGAVSTEARCLTNKRPIQGQLALMRLQNHSGQGLKGYQIELAHPSCADAADVDGAPVRLDGVRTVQILTSDVAGEQKLDSLIGEKIVVAGYLDAPDPARHTGDAVLSNAWLIAVPSTDEGAGGGAVVADDGQADDGGVQPEPGRTEIATLRPDGTASPYQPPVNADRSDIEARLARFVTDFYLSGENISPDVLRGIYARKVNYYGKPGTSIDKIVTDKLNYFSRWPVREFTLRPGSLAIRPLRADGRIYDLTFVFDFREASATKHSGGTGYARLEIDLAEGHGKIVRESGKVIGRN